ncbi:hypothetical protein Q5H91_03995 [Sphingomonas sp. KR1UV-12]|uniref:Uncharacterized protein n=1 Tax=Sphingomonas aurea TaxID=3063994 RepID=A0ABT9EIA3_9SPHN|nr:hypothetical protein [Sphingomonas sp. KR1UV-12]MDP1026363.1 hypothetical protein [Sphingomonas sp. KR1UV-12]
MTARARFTQSDVSRAMKAAREAGYDHVRVGIDVQGNIVVDASNAPMMKARENPLDRLLLNR